VTERRLDWPDLRNARDLGGLATGGGVTRTGALVRSDTLRQLTPDGWSALKGFGIRTILDLRFRVEVAANEPLDAGPGGLSRELGSGAADGAASRAGVQTVYVSILGDPDKALGEHLDGISRAQPDEAGSTRAVYLEMLELFRPRFVRAVAAIAEAEDGGMLVHCHAGKDRTGLVVALLLGAVGVTPDAIAADYALSGPNLAASLAAWIDDADDADEREHRRRVGLSPERAMIDVLEALDGRYGGAVGYLSGGGLPERDLDRVRERLVA
jgi:protein tyrosine/serine phosphatase